jgi:hypothetical protein
MKKGRDWKKYFASRYDPEPPESTDRCDKVSEVFNQSIMDRVIIIYSHGGVVDDGTNQRLKQPMFRTGQPVIFPVRYGSTINIRSTWITDLLSNLPLPTVDHPKLTGAQLIVGLDRGLNLSNTCIRQYDVGTTHVPNLEIFTPGVHLGDDDIVLFEFDTVERKCRSLKSLFRRMNIKSVREKLRTIKKNKRRIVLNDKPLYKTSSRYKRKMNQPKDHPLTLADLCDAEHGLFKKLTIDGYNLSKIPVVVLACRAGIAWDSGSTTSSNSSTHSHQMKSPVSSDYLTADSTADECGSPAPGGGGAAQERMLFPGAQGRIFPSWNMAPGDADDDDIDGAQGYRFTERADDFGNDGRFPGGGCSAQEYRFTPGDDFGGGCSAQEYRFTPGDDFGGGCPAQEYRFTPGDDFGGGCPAQEYRFTPGDDFGTWNMAPDDEFPGDADDDDMEFPGGSRNATKNRGNRRRNATKKRRK